MKKMKEKLHEVSEMKNTLTGWVKEEISKGKDGCQTEELGKAVDMIKDLAETEEKCMKACYYHKIVEAMEEAEKHEGRYGYNNRHLMNGEFASKGRGHVVGYHIPHHMMEESYIDDYFHNPDFSEMMRYGYNNGSERSNVSARGSNYGSGRSGYDMNQDSSRRGSSYDNYQDARRHYTETKSAHDKEHMEIKQREYLTDVIMALREMWDESSDTAMKREMKSNLTALVGEMIV